ncbi:MAG: sensor histidine kinase [Desulfobacteraceae bacterium]|nr:MAG: sensor histidine kinase [Desulfobacteraceae bacterium]
MSTLPDLIGQAGLQYFGRTTASVSHELKNVLAIIKENAGLLNDYLLMMDKGMPVDPARFKVVAARIEEQTQRADKIIKNMNRFAHSVDDPFKSIDLNDLVALVSELSLREAAMHQVAFSFAPAVAPAPIRTAPFWLLILLGRCLNFALQTALPGQTIILQTARSEDGVQISVEPLNGLLETGAGSFPQEIEATLLSALNATFRVDGTAGRITIELPNC